MPRMPACFTVSARSAGLAVWRAGVAALSSMGAFSPDMSAVHGWQGVFGEDVPQQFGIGCAERAVGDDEQVHGVFCKVLSGHCKRFQAA